MRTSRERQRERESEREREEVAAAGVTLGIGKQEFGVPHPAGCMHGMPKTRQVHTSKSVVSLRPELAKTCEKDFQRLLAPRNHALYGATEDTVLGNT